MALSAAAGDTPAPDGPFRCCCCWSDGCCCCGRPVFSAGCKLAGRWATKKSGVVPSAPKGRWLTEAGVVGGVCMLAYATGVAAGGGAGGQGLLCGAVLTSSWKPTLQVSTDREHQDVDICTSAHDRVRAQLWYIRHT